MNYQNLLLHVQRISLHNHYIYYLLNNKYNLSTIKINNFLRQDKKFIKIAFNIKTNYKTTILIVIQSSMPKIKIPKKKQVSHWYLDRVYQNPRESLATHGGPWIRWSWNVFHWAATTKICKKNHWSSPLTFIVWLL
jgi:hypothetical protein